MANLVITIIGIIFAAALAVAGISYINPHAYVEHNQATTNTSQVESIVGDYETLARNLGHRPTAADFQSQFPVSSATSQYNYNSTAGQTTLSLNAAMGGSGTKWTYKPDCGTGSTPQDCFCVTITDASDTTYKSAQMSALSEMNGPTQSRLELGSACDDAQAKTDPHQWASSAPAQGYTLTLRLAGGTPAVAAAATLITYSAVYTPGYTRACGATTTTIPSNWTCVGSDGSVQSDRSKCVTPTPQPTQDYSLCSIGGAWSVTGYGTCINGSQTITRQCMVGTTQVPDSQCPTLSPGQTTQACSNTAAASQYTYSASNAQYGTCQAACGTSTAPLSSWTCTRSDGQIVDQSYCTYAGTTPASTQACASYITCAASSPVYGTCSNTCGSGTQNLTSFTCSDGTNAPVDSSHCTSPARTQSCSATSSCTYTASASAYGGCTPACGSSVANASAWTCRQSDGTTVPQSVCLAHGVSPTSSACTDYSACTAQNVSYSSTCSNTCGTGTEALNPNWTCGLLSQTTTDKSKCTAPAPTQSCSNYGGCTYTASNPTTYGSCSTTCGTGTQTATAYTCTRSDGTSVAQSYCTAPSRSCTSMSQCVVHASYGACSTTCGNGTQTLNPGWTCTDSSGKAAPASDCTAPTQTQSCTVTSGCTYSASNGSNWGSCSTTCGIGTQSAGSFTCTRSDGTSVAQSYCTAPSRACTSTTQCIPHSSYGSCSTSCGTGTQILLPGWTCSDVAGQAAPALSYCSAPIGLASCSATSGCTYTASNPTAYGSCSTTCGNGTQMATAYTCTRSDGTSVAQSYCSAPSRSCSSTSQCVVHATYGTCSATCGNGTQPLNSNWTCTDSNGNASPTRSNCATPASTQSCSSTSSCSYSAGNPTAWGACSTTCGTGTQTATAYTCTRSDGTSVAQSYCTAPTEACTATSGCAYTYQIVNVIYSATCSPADCGAISYKAPISHQCQRSDGTIVDNSYCNGQSVPLSTICRDYSTCFTYTGSNPVYGTCVASCNGSTPVGSKSLPTAVDPVSGSYYSGFTCTRSDGLSAQDQVPGCQALVSNGTIPATVTCTPTPPATCH